MTKKTTTKKTNTKKTKTKKTKTKNTKKTKTKTRTDYSNFEEREIDIISIYSIKWKSFHIFIFYFPG